MNFNFNNQRNFHVGTPLMRQFTTIGFIPAKPESQFGFNKPESILHGAQSRFFSSYAGNKSFTNPNFVNKQNPNILTPSVAGIINFDTPKLSKSDHIHQNFCVQQPKPEITKTIQPQSEIKSSQSENKNSFNPLMAEHMLLLSPKSSKKNLRVRNRKIRRCKAPIEMKSKMSVKIKCSSPKRIKKDVERGRNTKKCKPWHKFDTEFIINCEEPETPDDNCQSSPIDIKLPESRTISYSPEMLSCLSSSTSSDACSFSPQSPAIHRIRMPSECDSEDSFIVFCDDVKSCASENSVDCDFSDTELSDSCDSDFDCIEFIEKTDLNREETKKKVSFKCDQDLCQIHPMVAWGFAYRESRKGPWEEMARDRARFRMRIQDTDFKLKKIFNSKHREKIYKERFENYVN